jgi:hypothetical protein
VGIRVLPLASISLLAVAALAFLMERRLYERHGRLQNKPRLNQANVCSGNL